MKKLLSIILLSAGLITCKDEDPCEAITCLNDGTCVNGTCQCTERYTGPDCSQQMKPSSIMVTKIEVLDFPATEEDGGGWDLTSGPDIFVSIHNDSDGLLIGISSGYHENANPDIIYEFTGEDPIALDANTDYVIALWDYDYPDDDELMIALTFDPYDDTNGFPETLDITHSKASFKLYFDYLFN